MVKSYHEAVKRIQVQVLPNISAAIRAGTDDSQLFEEFDDWIGESYKQYSISQWT
jgi:hypothetical protein